MIFLIVYIQFLGSIFLKSNVLKNTRKLKNHLIAKAIMAVLFSNQQANGKKNDIFTILKDCLIKSLNQVDVDKAEYYSRKISQKEEILNGQLLSLQLDKKYVTISKNDLLISFIESTGFKFLKFINKQNILKLEVKIKNKLLFQEHVVKRVCTYFQEVFSFSYKRIQLNKKLVNLLTLVYYKNNHLAIYQHYHYLQ